MVARGRWLPAEDHLGEFFSPRDITHKMVGSRANKQMSVQKATLL